MEKEKNQVQNETANNATQQNVNVTDLSKLKEELGFTANVNEEVQSEEYSKFIVIPDLLLRCKTTVKNSRTYKDYILCGKLRGVTMEVYARPRRTRSGFTDVAQYKLLDLVFGNSDATHFAVQIIRRTDAITQRTSVSMEYVAYAKDETTNDEIYAPLQFETPADKATLRQLLIASNRKNDLNLPL